jgi:hypothetical protein
LSAGSFFEHVPRALSISGFSTTTLRGTLRIRVSAPGALEVFKARAPNVPGGPLRDAVYLRAAFATSGFESVFSPLPEGTP